MQPSFIHKRILVTRRYKRGTVRSHCVDTFNHDLTKMLCSKEWRFDIILKKSQL